MSTVEQKIVIFSREDLAWDARKLPLSEILNIHLKEIKPLYQSDFVVIQDETEYKVLKNKFYVSDRSKIFKGIFHPKTHNLTKEQDREMQQNYVIPKKAKLLKATIETDGGPWATHNMPCCIYKDKPAVYQLSGGVFLPSWKAQKEGYMLVKHPKWLWWFFKKFRV